MDSKLKIKRKSKIRKWMNELFSLRISILIIVILCWLLPTVVLGSFLGTRFFTTLKEKTEVSLTTASEQAQVRLKENVDALVMIAKEVVYDGVLSGTISSYDNDEITYEEYFSACRSYLEQKHGRERLLDFSLFFRIQNPTGIFYTTDDYPEAIYFQQNLLKYVLEISDELDTGCLFFSHNDRMYMVRNLFNTRLQKYGMLVLGINSERLFASAMSTAKEINAECCIRLDDFVLGNDQYMDVEAGMGEAGEILLYTIDASTRDYTLRFQVQADKREVFRDMDTFRTIMMWIFMLLIPICILITMFLNRRIVQPIKLLSDASEEMSNGKLGVTVPMHGNDELGRLGSAFSSMSLRLQYMVEKSYKEEIALRDARIQAMQSRINSHFLNNALETINWQARMEGNETISTMVEALSCLLNASMDRNERHLVPLHEDLAVADAYFYFIGLRFGEKLTVWKHVEEGIENLLVPRIAIQTLVENAIEHGIAPMGGGRIYLTIYSRYNMLTVEVTNTGNKLTDDDLIRIRRLMSESDDAGGHMGIRNVSRRLRLLFGDKATMSIHMDERGQTVATFTMPAISEEDDLSGKQSP